MVQLFVYKGFDEEGIYAEPLREVAFGASHGGFYVFVASEPEGRKYIVQVEPSRDCCVNAYRLLDLESGDFLSRNLSGTAGDYFTLVSKILLIL